MATSSDESRLAKRQKISHEGGGPLIGTHDGTFHCDEALAVYLLRKTETYEVSRLVRTRKPEVLDTCDIVVDVGAIYDHSKLRYDHHQRGFTEVFGHGFGTKLSSAGLVYKHYGKEIIARILGWQEQDERVNTLWLKLYKEYIEAIDAIDNGISQYPNDLQPVYRSKTDISTRVGWLNPRWNVQATREQVDELFEKASKLVGDEFVDRLDYYGNAWLGGRQIVINAAANAQAGGRLLIFETFAPWKEHLFDIEKEHGQEGIALYVLYPDESGKWRIQAVPVNSESFESRKALPAAWRGLRDAELAALTGVDDAIFVHASGFIGGAHSKAGVEKLAHLALSS